MIGFNIKKEPKITKHSEITIIKLLLNTIGVSVTGEIQGVIAIFEA